MEPKEIVPARCHIYKLPLLASLLRDHRADSHSESTHLL
uniref:Heavy metal-associated isoprenylated plant protein 26-like n=1 Tax=Rhizophora mucronata TaxID=61149 RepID=A0A2P2Q507_RHIMU